MKKFIPAPEVLFFGFPLPVDPVDDLVVARVSMRFIKCESLHGFSRQYRRDDSKQVSVLNVRRGLLQKNSYPVNLFVKGFIV